MELITQYNLTGVAIGLGTFLIIGLFHPLVVKGEYYLGARCRWLFLAAGVAALAGAVLLADNVMVAALLGVTGFTCLWSIHEVAAQRRRVEKGWFPRNPRRRWR
ncbi:MAG: DUF4491 family protein [Alistipes sp.]|jgi:hypothetical protein|nr:DUF4491 family protein [Alistipes sp.]